MRSANIHVVTNDAKYGDTLVQDATMYALAKDVVFFEDYNLADLFFKNAGAGSNTTIYVVAIRMTEARKDDLGV